ncbi:BTAD domain-containing putative transcriptional regulator [Planomonospora corallina]|uniref:BTAD domain-containing putative transcriptional regulator n=1 Tax=Planomonospora corallina TaxID=1806052 RepID=A0ABV8I3A9_9ACTN
MFAESTGRINESLPAVWGGPDMDSNNSTESPDLCKDISFVESSFAVCGGSVSDPIRFRVLGPMEVRRGESWRTVAQGRGRVVLGLLLTHRSEVVTANRMIGECWTVPPESAESLVRRHVMKLRRILPDGALLTRCGGYLLDADAEEVDCAMFECLLHAGREKLAEGRADEAERELARALTLWSGPGFTGIHDSPVLEAERFRLAELRMLAVTSWVRAVMAQERYHEAAAAVRRILAGHPLNEGLWEQLMASLYLAGRRAEALGEFQNLRNRLVAAAGMEPGCRVQRLQQAMLDDDLEEILRLGNVEGRGSHR